VAHAHIYEVALSMTLLGAGFGLAFSAMSNIVVDSVPTHQTGVSSGMNANIRTIGGALGAALTASVITSSLQPSRLPTESGYTRGFLLLGLAGLLAALAATLIPRGHAERDAHQEEQAEMTHAAAALVPSATIVGDEPE
jgi:MFS family permease